MQAEVRPLSMADMPPPPPGSLALAVAAAMALTVAVAMALAVTGTVSVTQQICCIPVCMRFSKHRPSGPMLSISRNVRLFVRLFVRPSVCPSVCSLLRYHLNVFLPPLPEVRCPIFLEIRNPWGKVMERSGLRLKHFFALQNMVETTLPDGLETSGRKAYR